MTPHCACANMHVLKDRKDKDMRTHGDYEEAVLNRVTDILPSLRLPRANELNTKYAQQYAIARMVCYHATRLHVEKRNMLLAAVSDQLPSVPGNHLLLDDLHVCMTVEVPKPGRRISEPKLLGLLTTALGDEKQAKTLIDAAKVEDKVQHRLQPTLKR